MLVAEAPMIDPGLVVLLLLVFALVVAAGIALVVWTLLGGYRWGREPWRRGMRNIWAVGMAAETFAVALAVAGGEPGAILATVAVLGASAFAPALGGRRGPPEEVCPPTEDR